MKYIICDIDGTLVDSRHRNHLLPMWKGSEVIRSSFDVSEVPAGTKGKIVGVREVPERDESIVDILWETEERSRSYPWKRFMQVTNASWKPWHEAIPNDTAIPHWVWLVKALRFQMISDGFAFLFLTSRHESSRGTTEAQLREIGVTIPGLGDKLEMRPEDDPRKDTVFKGAVLDSYEAQGHTFLFGLDDRKTVADFLRSRDIPALHVAEYA